MSLIENNNNNNLKIILNGKTTASSAVALDIDERSFMSAECQHSACKLAQGCLHLLPLLGQRWCCCFPPCPTPVNHSIVSFIRQLAAASRKRVRETANCWNMTVDDSNRMPPSMCRHSCNNCGARQALLHSSSSSCGSMQQIRPEKICRGENHEIAQRCR